VARVARRDGETALRVPHERRLEVVHLVQPEPQGDLCQHGAQRDARPEDGEASDGSSGAHVPPSQLLRRKRPPVDVYGMVHTQL
jgi:hypothetical protein